MFVHQGMLDPVESSKIPLEVLGAGSLLQLHYAIRGLRAHKAGVSRSGFPLRACEIRLKLATQ